MLQCFKAKKKYKEPVVRAEGTRPDPFHAVASFKTAFGDKYVLDHLTIFRDNIVGHVAVYDCEASDFCRRWVY